MNNNEEQKFIKLFKSLRAVRPPEELLHRTLAVTPAYASRFFTWRYTLVFSSMAALLALVYLGPNRGLDLEGEVLAMEIAGEELGDEIELLDTNYYEEIEGFIE